MSNIFASLTRGASFAKSKNTANNLSRFKGDSEKVKNTSVDLKAFMIPSAASTSSKSGSFAEKKTRGKRVRAESAAEQEEEDSDAGGDLQMEGTDDSDNEEDSNGDRNTSNIDSDSDGDSTGKNSGFKSQEDINAFRNAMQIKIRGANGEERADVAAPCPTFDIMNIHAGVQQVILQNIEQSNWKEPTPIQMQAIPALLSGRDILAAAPTGSGKTAAFVIPVLSIVSQALAEEKVANKASGAGAATGGVRALLLAPTRELAEQIHREATRLCAGRRLKLCLLKKNTNTSSQSKQDKNAYASYDVLVSTPLRLVALLRDGSLNLSYVRVVALDEADKLFELKTHGRRVEADSDEDDDAEWGGGDNRRRSSFLAQIDEILASCPREGVRRALFSATIGAFVAELASQFLQNPVHISIGTENTGASTIDQRLVFVGREDGKLLAIQQLVQEGLKPPVLLFVQSIDRAKELYQELAYDGINVDVIHAEKSQQSREETIRRFRAGDIWVLICTELMARGVDFKGVQMVINYDLPQSSVDYIHRIGRTGRAGKRGTAVTFFTEEDIPRIRSIANVVKLSGCEIPEWMLSIPKLTTKQKRQFRTSVPMRRRITTTVQPIRIKPGAAEEDDENSGVIKSHKKRNRKNKGNGKGEESAYAFASVHAGQQGKSKNNVISKHSSKKRKEV